jgi:hypothetical protein
MDFLTQVGKARLVTVSQRPLALITRSCKTQL